MHLEEFKKKITNPLTNTTLCFFIKDKEILLAMKKRGFGSNKWNGTGGKSNPGESIEEAATRETTEEITAKPKELKKVGVLDFYFIDSPIDKDWNQQVHVFMCEKWEGEIEESEEMKPQWFKINEIPYDSMWPDDIYWLPKVLEGNFVNAEFLFDKNENIIDYTLKLS